MLSSKLYPGCIIYGPYLDSQVNRYYIRITRKGAYVTKMLYSRFSMQEHLGRFLLTEEEVDHKDENQLNDSIDNLQLLTKAENIQKSRSIHLDARDFECLYCGCIFTMSRQQQRGWKYTQRKGNEGPFCSRSHAAKFQHENGRR